MRFFFSLGLRTAAAALFILSLFFVIAGQFGDPPPVRGSDLTLQDQIANGWARVTMSASGTYGTVRSAYIENQDDYQTFASEVARINTLFGYNAILAMFFIGYLIRMRSATKILRATIPALTRKYPVPAFRQWGVTDRQLESIRALFLWTSVYFLYELAHIPLTYNSNEQIAFWFDVLARALLIFLMFSSLLALYQRIDERTETLSEENRGRLKEWFEGKTDEHGASLMHVRNLAITLGLGKLSPMVVGVSPIFLNQLFQ